MESRDGSTQTRGFQKLTKQCLEPSTEVACYKTISLVPRLHQLFIVTCVHAKNGEEPGISNFSYFNVTYQVTVFASKLGYELAC